MIDDELVATMKAEAEMLRPERQRLQEEAQARQDAVDAAWGEFFKVDRRYQALLSAAHTLEKKPYPKQLTQLPE